MYKIYQHYNKSLLMVYETNCRISMILYETICRISVVYVILFLKISSNCNIDVLYRLRTSKNSKT